MYIVLGDIFLLYFSREILIKIKFLYIKYCKIKHFIYKISIDII